MEIYTKKCGIQVPCAKTVKIQTRLDQEHELNTTCKYIFTGFQQRKKHGWGG